MWAFLVASWPGVLKVQGIDGRVEGPGLGELVSAGELAAARGTGELAETLLVSPVLGWTARHGDRAGRKHAIE
jgi:hypothetical protein